MGARRRGQRRRPHRGHALSERPARHPDAVIAERDGALALSVGPGGGRSYALRHFDRDVFLAFPAPELPELASAVRLSGGPAGKATDVTVEWLNDWGLGTVKHTE